MAGSYAFLAWQLCSARMAGRYAFHAWQVCKKRMASFCRPSPRVRGARILRHATGTRERRSIHALDRQDRGDDDDDDDYNDDDDDYNDDDYNDKRIMVDDGLPRYTGLTAKQRSSNMALPKGKTPVSVNYYENCVSIQKDNVRYDIHPIIHNNTCMIKVCEVHVDAPAQLTNWVTTVALENLPILAED